jgi:uncharacterized membrane protein
MRCTASVSFSYFSIFLASLLITFLSPQVATCISVHVPFLLTWITLSGLCLAIIIIIIIIIIMFYHLHAGYLQLCT